MVVREKDIYKKNKKNYDKNNKRVDYLRAIGSADASDDHLY